MSTVGLRQRSSYEEVLAQANKDESRVEGIISPYLQNAATKIISNPEFQRVKDRLQEDLKQQEVHHIERKTFEHNITNMSVEASINRNDLQYIVENLQRPGPPGPPGEQGPPGPPGNPPPQMPSNDAEADRIRIAAELDGLARDREKQMRDELMAQRNAMFLAAQRVQTVPQQIVNNFHQAVATPVAPIAPDLSGLTAEVRATGQSVHHLLLRQQAREIPAEMPGYSNPPPPPAPPMAIRRPIAVTPAPQQGVTGPYAPLPQPPPPPSGSSSSRAMAPAIRQKVKQPRAKNRRSQKVTIAEDSQIAVEATTGNRPASAPSSGAERIRVGKRGADSLGSGQGRGLVPMEPITGRPFQGAGKKLDPTELNNTIVGPGQTVSSLGGGSGKNGVKILGVRSSYDPFAGRGQRLDAPPAALRESATQRMRELGQEHARTHQRSEAMDRENERSAVRRRTERRGGAPGDVVPLGKRVAQQGSFVSRQRVGERPVGPQRFTLG